MNELSFYFYNYWELIVKYSLILFLVCFSFYGCSWINEKLGQKDDWFGEEFLEDIIEMETGLKLDLTPASPEN